MEDRKRCADCLGSIEKDPRRYCSGCPTSACPTRVRGIAVIKPYTRREKRVLNKFLKEARDGRVLNRASEEDC